MARILLVEDTDSLREILEEVLSSQGHEVKSAGSAEAALEILYLNSFDLILTDLKLPKKSGLDFIVEARQLNRFVPIVLMTAFGTIDIAVRALKLGAQDFITKPFTPEYLAQVVTRHLIFTDVIEDKHASCALITQNAKMQEILKIAKKLGPLPTSILILGESGSGKEVLARYIHEMANSPASPFVGVNCASIPKNLMESEFFGYEPGAFTGASTSKEGLFEAAHRGTLFLDEVAEMPVSLQVKLLRAIQEGETRRLGAVKSKSVNVRIISATNRNLEDQISKREFREDLYYRLGVFVIEVPPLRSRKDDIPLLVEHFMGKFKESLGYEHTSITQSAMTKLVSYDWPGNVRELENIVERALIFSGGEITKEHVSLSQESTDLSQENMNLLQIAEAAQRNAETSAILQALTHHGGNKSKAAVSLGVSYKTLLTKIKQYDLEF